MAVVQNQAPADEQFIKEKEASIFRFLDSAYVKIDSASYPQTFKVGVYDPKPIE